MDKQLAEKLDPKAVPNTERQRTIEGMAFSQSPPPPDLWRTIIPLLEDEPVKWIRQLEIRLLKRFPFRIDLAEAILSLLDSSQPDLRSDAAVLLDQMIDRLVVEGNAQGLKDFEKKCFDTLLSYLNREEITSRRDIWIPLYKILANLDHSERVSGPMVDLLPKGGEDALFVFAQYIQGKYPSNGLAPLLDGLDHTKSDNTAVHLLRGLQVTFSKDGSTTGYPTTENMIQHLLRALKNFSENIRCEAAAVLAMRARDAKKNGTHLPMEGEVWDAVFHLYSSRLPSTTAYDKDQAKAALVVLPVNQDRLSRLFELLNRIDDELQKQNVVGLIGGFKTPETRGELLRMLKENFAALRLEAQRTTLEAVSAFLPDDEVEAEMDKLLEGKGLHADIQAKLADKLFTPLPSLKKRLMYWLGLNEKTKRPMIERFELPMMHIKVIQSARKLSKDKDILLRLKTIEPLIMMNDAKVKLHETLKAFPSQAAPEVYSMDKLAEAILSKIGMLDQARIVFVGFDLPSEFGDSKELEYGNKTQTDAQGLGLGAAQMGKDFVKQAIENIFSGDYDDVISPDSRFQLAQEENTLTVTSVTQ
ncbi:MAG: hypothetical protein ACE5GK_07580 [Nitrospiria bacterium]